MSAISGTRRAMKEMADGTIRVSIDIDPKYRTAFLESFSQIDMPVAIAPLVADFERNESEQEKQKKGGELCKLACRFSNDPKFIEWSNLNSGHFGQDICNPQNAAEFIRFTCSISSRADLDQDEIAARDFHNLIRIPYSEWLKERVHDYE